MHPELAANGSLAHLPLGRLPRRDDPRTLALASYLDDAVALPEIPPTFDLTHRVGHWPMYGNDRLGDCTCAAAGHMIQAWTVAAGKPATPTDAAVEKLYWSTGNADDGRVELDVLSYWRKHGLGHGHKIDAYVAVDPKNADHVRAAIYLFGGVYVGVALPETAQTQSYWDVAGDGSSGPSAPGSWGGHAVPYLGYDEEAVGVVTWGAVLRASWAFNAAYCDEAYAVVSKDYLAKTGRTASGFDLAALEADLATLEAR